MIKEKDLHWGKPCRTHKHQKEDGTNLRVFNRCAACEDRFKNTTLSQDEIYTILSTPKVPHTDEYVRAKRVAASMRWNAKNKHKTKEYQSTYAKKPERKERVKNILAKKYQEMPPEQKAERIAKAAAYYVKRKEIMLNDPEYAAKKAEREAQREIDKAARAKMTPEELRAHRREIENAAYNRKTPEQKEIIKAKRHEYYMRKRDKDTDDS